MIAADGPGDHREPLGREAAVADVDGRVDRREAREHDAARRLEPMGRAAGRHVEGPAGRDGRATTDRG